MDRKYIQGDRVTTIEEFEQTTMIYWNGKPRHNSFYSSWQFYIVMRELRAGKFYKAELITSKEVSEDE